jgi:hypothetical protein
MRAVFHETGGDFGGDSGREIEACAPFTHRVIPVFRCAETGMTHVV